MNKLKIKKAIGLLNALALTLPGVLLAWIGFIFPGWLWCFNFVSNESISLFLITIVGLFGLALVATGFGVFCASVLYAKEETQ